MTTRKNPHAAALGKLGGAAKTPAKAAASRANGAKGGRPAARGCFACGRPDVRKRPGRGKQTYAHKCPHGVDCLAGDPRVRAGGVNGPARGGSHYCPACVAAVLDSPDRPR